MNYLAHSYLSFSEGQLVGNMIADYTKNSEVKKLPEEIRKGIKIHREIDTFTDQHRIIHEAKRAFRPLVGLYAGAFVDVSLDYFLANDPHIYSEEQWKKHAERVYGVLNKYRAFLPERFLAFLPKMAREDWLFNYRYDRGVQFSLRNVLYKAKYLEKDVPVFEAFIESKTFLGSCYRAFFPELVAHIEKMVGEEE